MAAGPAAPDSATRAAASARGRPPSDAMKGSGIFIRRPGGTPTLMSAFVLFGWFAYRDLPVAELPSVDFPTISVSANLPGADPQTMAATVDRKSTRLNSSHRTHSLMPYSPW